MTDEELQAINDAAACPVDVICLPNGRLRLDWGDDPLDYITLSEGQARQLLGDLREALS